MLSREKDGKTNIYAVNSTLFENPKEAKIKDRVFKIKDVPVDNAKKFLSSFVDNPELEDVNDYAKQVKNELDFKCVFSEIVNNNKNNIDKIVNKNHQQLDVINKMRKEYKDNPNFENELLSLEEAKKKRGIE